MKLITKAIAKQLIKADLAFVASADGKTLDNVVVKFFTPWAGATWYVATGTPLDSDGEPDYETTQPDDWHLYGFCDLGDRDCAEFGYVLLSQLLEIKGPFGLKVERDMHYSGKLSEVSQ